MTMTTLTPAQWREVFALPGDGQPYNVPGIAFRATHFPATKLKCEYVVASTQFGTLRRRLVGGKWQATEHIAG